MIDVMTPRQTVNDESVIVVKVWVKSGDVVKKDQAIVEVETSKVNIEITSPADGVLVHELMIGQEIDVSSRLFSIDQITRGSAADVETSPHKESISKSTVVGTVPVLSKAALALAKDLHVDATQLSGAWITKADVERAADLTPMSAGTINARPFAANPPYSEISGLAIAFNEEPLSKRKRAEIDSLTIGNHAATTSTVGIAIRLPGERFVEPPFMFKKGVTDLIVFEGARLIVRYPELNGFYLNSKTWVKFKEINFGISFDNGQNLKVLAIKNADRLDLLEIQQKVQALLELYESEVPIPTEMVGISTVTLSDLSNEDISFMLPLINGRQSLILGVVRLEENHFVIYASFDHRLAEGLRVSRFLAELRDRIMSYYRDADGNANINCYACGKSMEEEILLGNRGFIRITVPNGRDEKVCRTCFEGR